MNKQIIIALFFLLVGSAAKSQDTLLFQNFNDWPYYLVEFDSVFTSFDEDAIPDYNGLPGGWFVGGFENGGADSTEVVALSSSWLSGFAPGNRNWLLFPAFHLNDNTGLLRWRSAPALGNLYMDGYTVVISTDPDFYYDVTLQDSDTLMHFAQNTNNDENTFSNGIQHTNLDMNAPMNISTATQYPGLLTEYEVDLSAYAGQTVYIGFLHNSDDDNFIALDDILLLGNGGMVGVHENHLENVEVQLYPNPAKDIIHLAFELEQSNEMEMRVTNVAGQLVYSDNINAHAGGNRYQVDIANLEAGMYILQVQSGEEVISKRFVKH